MLCSEATLVKYEPGGISARILHCNAWSCEICQPRRKRRLIAEGISGRPNSFITLTCNPAYGTDPSHRARMMVTAWRTVRRWIMDWYGYPTLPFLAVFEKTKAGEPHLHILARCRWIDQKLLSFWWEMLIGAPVVWIARIKGQQEIAGYVAKYIGKDPQPFSGTKRYWFSQDYRPDVEHDDEASWLDKGHCAIVPLPLESVIDDFSRMGYRYEQVRDVVHFYPFEKASWVPPPAEPTKNYQKPFRA